MGFPTLVFRGPPREGILGHATCPKDGHQVARCEIDGLSSALSTNLKIEQFVHSAAASFEMAQKILKGFQDCHENALVQTFHCKFSYSRFAGYFQGNRKIIEKLPDR